MASPIALTTEPYFSGRSLVWGGTLDPGSFESKSAGSTQDNIDCFKMTANDPAGLDVTSEMVLNVEVGLPHDLGPGDSYQSSAELELHDGYYHVMLELDSLNDGPTYQLHVAVEHGQPELKSYYAT